MSRESKSRRGKCAGDNLGQSQPPAVVVAGGDRRIAAEQILGDEEGRPPVRKHAAEGGNMEVKLAGAGTRS
jgi:hypothetical protein